MSAATDRNIAPGQSLPGLVIPLTASAIVAAAIATNDFEKVHHDQAAAKAAGVPDIFMNILSTNGMVQRYVAEWAGSAARIVGIDVKLGTPNFAGDEMKLNGVVGAVDGPRFSVEVIGRNRIGTHVEAVVHLVMDQRIKGEGA